MPGEWAGTMAETVEEQVSLLISQKKLERGIILIIRSIIEELELRSVLNHKQLERDRGFLVYLSRTYRSMIPYLKGNSLVIRFVERGKGCGWLEEE